MTIKTLYKYDRGNNKMTISPNMPTNVNYTTLYRLIADDDKMLVKDNIQTNVIDTNDIVGWNEIDDIISLQNEILMI